MTSHGYVRVMVASIAVSMPGAALATSYHCRNNDLEVQCDGATCSKSEGFTPTEVVVDLTKRTIEACLYSGCWAGPVRVLSNGKGFIFADGYGLQNHGPTPSRRDVAVVINKEASLASLVTSGFLNPMTCVTRRH